MDFALYWLLYLQYFEEKETTVVKMKSIVNISLKETFWIQVEQKALFFFII